MIVHMKHIENKESHIQVESLFDLALNGIGIFMAMSPRMDLDVLH